MSPVRVLAVETLMLSFAEVDSVSQKRWRELQKLAVIVIRYPLRPIQNLRYGLYSLARPNLWANDCPPNGHNCSDNVLKLAHSTHSHRGYTEKTRIPHAADASLSP